MTVHDEEQGTAVAVRGDLHVGISSIRDILYHLGDESPMEGAHELLLSVGFHWVPAIDYMTKN